MGEAELVAHVRAASAEALAAMYREYGAQLFRLAFRMLGSRPDAEDVVHDLFVGLPELMRRYEHREQLGPWMRGVVVRLCLDRQRRDRRRGLLLDGVEAGAMPSSTPADPWTAVDLERALASLSVSDRTVFALKQLEGYSHAEIASLLDITTGACRIRYHRALRRLRAILEPNP